VAIIAVRLLAGGVSVAAIAIPIVWWEFLPPQFEFSPLNGEDYHRSRFFWCAVGWQFPPAISTARLSPSYEDDLENV
jgi:hypothetical protein